MSISKLQKEHGIMRSVRDLYSTGEKPSPSEVMRKTEEYFDKFPVGVPLPVKLSDAAQNTPANPAVINNSINNSITNLQLLFAAAFNQANDLKEISDNLLLQLTKLRQKRKALEALMDDYLLSLYNTDGYFYSVSEQFVSLDNIDIHLTSAFIDLKGHSASIPSLVGHVKKFSQNNFRAVTINAFKDTNFNRSNAEKKDRLQVSTPYNFNACLDNMDNTVWYAEAVLDKEEAIVAEILVEANATNGVSVMSRIEADLYGVQPTQMFVETCHPDDTKTYEDFGTSIQTGTAKLVWVDEARQIANIKITLRKEKADFVEVVDGVTKYKYVLGFKNLVISLNSYDTTARYVSLPLQLPPELNGESFIDSVSITADVDQPANTNVKFYVASDDKSGKWLDDFVWHEIQPIQAFESDKSMVRFNGVAEVSRTIKSSPINSELALIPIDINNPVNAEKNPSPVIADDANVYRICKFDEDAVLDSLKLEEGPNSIKISYIDLDPNAVSGGLAFWADKFDRPDMQIAYGNIVGGNGFFYGGDIGEPGKSIYIETYLDSATDQVTVLKETRKSDANSKLWDVKLFLNGVEIADMPVGVDSFMTPWRFQKGLNHICAIINIPEIALGFPNPYIGILDVMIDDFIGNYGDVKLANWDYVDIFRLKHNEVGTPKTFSIYNNEIVSRRRPADIMRLRFTKPTGKSPNAIRVRADFERDVQSPTVSPTIKNLRVRFASGTK